MEGGKRVVVNGGVKLPIGYRFHPTDEEIVVHYLMRMAFGFPLPASVIPVFDVFISHPRTFPGDEKEKNRYFFCVKRKANNRSDQRIKIPSCYGYWKQIGKERQIIASGSNHLVGIRRTLAFCEANKSPSRNKTRWIMREYCLVGSAAAAAAQISGFGTEGEWAVYNVFQKKRKAISRRKNGAVNDYVRPSCIDFTIERADRCEEICPPPPSPPSSAEESAIGAVEEGQDETSTLTLSHSSYFSSK